MFVSNHSVVWQTCSALRSPEMHLAANEFLCAGRFTAADVTVGYALMLAELLGMNHRFAPAVTQYWQRLKTRGGFFRAVAAQDAAASVRGISKSPATAML